MCKLREDCDLHEKVDNVLQSQETIIQEQKDLRRDFDIMNRLVKNHDDILSKIDQKIAEGVSLGVDKSLKGLDERVGMVVKKELREAEYLKLKEEQDRKKGFTDHAIKQIIGIVVTGVIGLGVILFQIADKKNLNKTIEDQKSTLEVYKKEIKDIKDNK